MSKMRAGLLLLVLAVALPTADGCSLFNRAKKAAGPPAAPQEPVPLTVKNENFLDMNIAIVSGGMSRRVGTVSGSTTATFSISRTGLVIDDITVVATPIGGSGRAVSAVLTVNEGQHIDFRIAQVLRQSVAVVR